MASFLSKHQMVGMEPNRRKEPYAPKDRNHKPRITWPLSRVSLIRRGKYTHQLFWKPLCPGRYWAHTDKLSHLISSKGFTLPTTFSYWWQTDYAGFFPLAMIGLEWWPRHMRSWNKAKNTQMALDASQIL